jgi:hypothetical protein
VRNIKGFATLAAISHESLQVLAKKIEFAIDSFPDSCATCVSIKRPYPESEKSEIRRLLAKADLPLDDTN